MKKFLILAAAAAIAAPAALASQKAEPVNPDSTGYKFTIVKSVPTTSVKDQNKSGTCWCFATTSFFEDELLRKTGKTYDLSEMFSVYHCYDDKAKKYQRMGGTINFAQGGSALDVPYVWENYGVVPEEVYGGIQYGADGHDHYEMADLLTSYMKAIASPRKKLSPAWQKGLQGILDAYLGELPTEFTYEGKKYTPKSFAESLPLNMDDYISITSWTHHPFYTWFPVEVADNWLWEKSYNVPMEEMKAIVDNALEKGYPVVWSADVSEPGFKWNEGYAVLPEAKSEKDMDGTELARWVKLSDKEREAEKYDFKKGPGKEQTVTQASRQEGLDNLETTDDHGMELVGIATDQNGTRYYKVKNSWNTNQVYDGFFYVSEPYFLAKTMGIYVNKEALPAATAKRLKK